MECLLLQHFQTPVLDESAELLPGLICVAWIHTATQVWHSRSFCQEDENMITWFDMITISPPLGQVNQFPHMHVHESYKGFVWAMNTAETCLRHSGSSEPQMKGLPKGTATTQCIVQQPNSYCHPMQSSICHRDLGIHSQHHEPWTHSIQEESRDCRTLSFLLLNNLGSLGLGAVIESREVNVLQS